MSDAENSFAISDVETVDDAALAAQNIKFGDDDAIDPVEETTDDEKKVDEAEKKADDVADGEDKADGGGKNDDKTDDDEDDEDFIEVAGENEDDDPVRVPVSEVYEGYTKAQELQTELDELKAQQTQIPQEIETTVRENIETRAKLTEALEQWTNIGKPQMPSRDLLDPNSENYDPDRYAQELQQHDAMVAAQKEAETELQAQRDALAKEQQTLFEATRGREMDQLKQFWPELLSDKAAKAAFHKSMAEHYGASEDDLNQIVDHRFFKMAKDALAFRASQKANEKTVKVVRGKPKLVKGKARDTNTKRTNANAAMSQLAKSGSDDDGVAALAAIFED